MTPPLESKEFPVNEYRPVDGFVNPRTEPVAGSIRLAVTGAGPRRKVKWFSTCFSAGN